MGCVHTHQKIPAIEGWDILNRVQNTIKETRENNPKTKKIYQTLNQTPTFGLKHDKIQRTMVLKYFVKKYARKDMMVQTLQDGIMKLIHLLSDELFKHRKTHPNWGW
jgi:hypothetical protein